MATKQKDSVKFKPILFSSEMVRSIQGGHKTQTRRVVKLKAGMQSHKVGFTAFCDDTEFEVQGYDKNGNYGCSYFKLPYKVGDVMWVREIFWDSAYGIYYKADDEITAQAICCNEYGSTFKLNLLARLKGSYLTNIIDELTSDYKNISRFGKPPIYLERSV